MAGRRTQASRPAAAQGGKHVLEPGSLRRAAEAERARDRIERPCAERHQERLVADPVACIGDRDPVVGLDSRKRAPPVTGIGLGKDRGQIEAGVRADSERLGDEHRLVGETVGR